MAKEDEKKVSATHSLDARETGLSLSEAIPVIKTVIKTGHLCLIKGGHGIGKSSLIRQCAAFWGKELGFKKVVFLNLAQCVDGSDLTGIPFRATKTYDREVLDEKGGVTVEKITLNETDYASFSWMPKEKAIIVLDEINRANTAVLQAMMTAITEKVMGNVKLPTGTAFIAMANDGHTYETNDMDPAMKSRMTTNFVFKPSVEEWLDYMVGKGGNPLIINFFGYCATAAQHLDPPEDAGNDIKIHPYPDRRRWDALSDYFNALGVTGDEDFTSKESNGLLKQLEIFSNTTVGKEATLELMSYIKSSKCYTPEKMFEEGFFNMAEFERLETSFRKNNFARSVITVANAFDEKKWNAAKHGKVLRDFISFIQLVNRKELLSEGPKSRGGWLDDDVYNHLKHMPKNYQETFHLLKKAYSLLKLSPNYNVNRFVYKYEPTSEEIKGKTKEQIQLIIDEHSAQWNLDIVLTQGSYGQIVGRLEEMGLKGTMDSRGLEVKYI